jgi:hypothetical protein
MMYSSKDPEFVGKIPTAVEVTVMPADECKTLKLGWVVKECIGKAVISQSAINVAMGRKKVKSVIIE